MTEGIHGFSSPRADAFPSGLRVLVVDDDPTWLKILEKMLKKCSYEVTTCGLAIEALDLLRERKYRFDIVISDVNMPDMDGFKLLEHVGLEMDLPVIMMSVDGETSRVMRGVQHGACDYLLKPIRMKELQNIWQHVYRKKIHEVRDTESHEGLEEILMMRNVSEQSDDGYLLCGGDMTTGKKRKDAEHKHDDREFSEHSSSKKARVVWTVDLHQKFVKAVNQIGFEKVGPKKILDMMNVPRLTRENVASHLQKYRLYLSRLQKDNDLKTSFSGLKHSDFSQRNAVEDHSNPINPQYNDAVNSYQTPNNLFVQNIHKSIASSTDNVSTSYASESQKASSLSIGIGSTQYSTYDSPLPTQYSWNGEVSEIPQFQFHNDFNNLKLPLDSITHRHFSKAKGKQEKSNIKSKPSFDSFPLQSHNLIPSFRPPDDYVLEPTSINDFEGQYFFSTNLDTRIKGAPENTDQDFIAEVPSNLHESLRFDYEYPPDSLDYPGIDQALFIV